MAMRWYYERIHLAAEWIFAALEQVRWRGRAASLRAIQSLFHASRARPDQRVGSDPIGAARIRSRGSSRLAASGILLSGVDAPRLAIV